jgi:hypothetical protein
LEQLDSNMRTKMKRYCLHFRSCSLMKIKLLLVLVVVVVFSETESGDRLVYYLSESGLSLYSFSF